MFSTLQGNNFDYTTSNLILDYNWRLNPRFSGFRSPFSDKSSNSNVLTTSGNNATYQNQFVNLATSSYLNSTNSGITISGGAFTIEAYVRPRFLTGINFIFISQGSNIGVPFGMLMTSNRLNFYIGPGTGTQFSNTTPIVLNTWYHCIVQRSATGVYSSTVNTVKQTGGTNTAILESNNIKIGFNPSGSELFNGDIAFVRLYNRELTSTEIALNYLYALSNNLNIITTLDGSIPNKL
jgi:hypothetical protein